MIFRLLFFFVLLFFFFWGNYYLFFRTNYFSKARVFEIGKTALIFVISLVSALASLVLFSVLEKIADVVF